MFGDYGFLERVFCREDHDSGMCFRTAMDWGTPCSRAKKMRPGGGRHLFGLWGAR